MRIKTLAAFGAALILAACGNPSQEEAIAGNNFDSSESDSSDTPEVAAYVRSSDSSEFPSEEGNAYFGVNPTSEQQAQIDAFNSRPDEQRLAVLREKYGD